MSVELNFKNNLYQFTANTQLEKVITLRVLSCMNSDL